MPAFGLRPRGKALVRAEGGEYLFVALLENGVEVRGRAQFAGESLQATWENASASDGNNVYAVSGVALEQAPGRFECYGQSDFSGASYEFVAGRLPEPGA